MKNLRRRALPVLVTLLLCSALSVTAFATGEEVAEVSRFYQTIWSLLPPVVAIILALITKEVYSSLFIGIVSGALLYTNFSPIGTVNAIFDMMGEKLGDSWNIGILIFLVFLGIMVALMTKAGGSAAYGEWANRKIISFTWCLWTLLCLCLV